VLGMISILSWDNREPRVTARYLLLAR